MISVLFKINFEGSTGLIQLTSDYTAYPNEEEVLVQDGLEYKVLSKMHMKDEESGKPYAVVEMEYPVKEEADHRIGSYIMGSLKMKRSFMGSDNASVLGSNNVSIVGSAQE